MYHLGEELDSVLAFLAFVGPQHPVPRQARREQAFLASMSPPADTAVAPSEPVRVRIRVDPETGAYLRG